MLTSGDVVDLDLGTPVGREAGFRHPAVVITAQRILDNEPSVVHVVPLTTTIRRSGSEVQLLPDERNGLDARSAAQCQHLRSVSSERVAAGRGNLGPVVLGQLREVVALLLDLA